MADLERGLNSRSPSRTRGSTSRRTSTDIRRSRDLIDANAPRRSSLQFIELRPVTPLEQLVDEAVTDPVDKPEGMELSPVPDSDLERNHSTRTHASASAYSQDPKRSSRASRRVSTQSAVSRRSSLSYHAMSSGDAGAAALVQDDADEFEADQTSSLPATYAASKSVTEDVPSGGVDQDLWVSTDKEGGEKPESVVVIDWDGPEDPSNPKNWPFSRKWAATIVVSAFTFLTPVSSSMIAPASNQLATALNIQSGVELAMATSVFVLAYAFGPLFLGPLSEMYGRARVIQLANVFYLVFNLACGFAKTKSELIAFRFLAGIGGSAPLTIGAGVLGDVWRAEERGQAVAIYTLGPLLGPVVGPIAGAWVAQKSTWKWVFYSTTIVDAAVQMLGLFFLRETFPPVLLERKAVERRKALGYKPGSFEGRTNVRTVFAIKAGAEAGWKKVWAKNLIRPFALFVREPIIIILGVYMAFIYGTIYLVLTTITDLFMNSYHESVGIAGLNYIALGLGFSGVSQLQARLVDPLYKRLTAKNGGKSEPEFRLPFMIPASINIPVGLIIYGWSAQYRVHWIVPDIGLFLIAAGMVGNFQSIQTYVIDAFTLHAASALAAVSFLRSLFGFGFPLFAPYMYDKLGYGWGNTLLAFLAIAIGCPAGPLLYKYGAWIRRKSTYAVSSE